MKTIIGIGIGEDVQIVWNDIDEKTGRYLREYSSLTWTEPTLNDPSLNEDAHCVLRRALQRTRDDRACSHLFANASGVAFAAIGHVDRDKKQLTRATRKNWRTLNRGSLGSCAINFRLLKDEFFPQVENRYFLVNKDASCVALAEKEHLPDENSIFYITINEGVSVGIVHQGFDLHRGDNHPSFGHAYPRPHTKDFNFFSQSACPHGNCFYALASAVRIRESWGDDPGVPESGELGEFPDEHEAWDIIAFYIAQLCVAGYTMFVPKRIILGGTVMWGIGSQGETDRRARKIQSRLMPLIWRHFDDLSGNESRGRRTDIPRRGDGAKKAKELIQRGSVYSLANGRGALALARVPHMPWWRARTDENA